MAFSQETFPSDLILPGLVDWFNNQSLAIRTIATTDVALFKVKVIVDETGTAQMIIGDAPYANANATFLCEATFVWKGTRGADLQATPASFFEVSKFVPQKASGGAINIIPFVGTVELEEEVAVEIGNRIMGYGFTNMNGGFTTVGLRGTGHPEDRTTAFYMNGTDYGNLTFKKVSGGEGWFVGLTDDGSVYGWGYNTGLVSAFAGTPIKIDLSNWGSSSTAKDIAAVGKAIQVIDANNVCYLIGDTALPSSPPNWTNAKQIDSIHVWNEYDNRVQQVVVYGISATGESFWWGVDVDGNTVNSIASAPSTRTNVRQVAFNSKFGALVHNDDTLEVWGDSNALSYLPYVDSMYQTNVESVHMMNQGGIVILYKSGQLRWWTPVEQQWFSMANAKQVSAGYKHLVALFMEGNVDCRGSNAYGQLNYPNFSQPVRQVFAGGRHSVAMMEDGSLVWWGEGENSSGGISVGGGSGYAIG